MKRMLLALLLVVLTVLPALAAGEAAYASTQAFIDALAERDVACKLHAVDKSGSELVTLDVSDGSIGLSYTVQIRFDATGEAAYLTIPAVITFGELHREEVIRACNTLNCDYMYTRFIADEAEGAVNVSIDLLLGRQDTGEVVLEAFDRLVSILSEAYFTLAVFSG